MRVTRARPGRRSRERRVRARAPRRGRGARPAGARHLPRDAGAQRLARRDLHQHLPDRRFLDHDQAHLPFQPVHGAEVERDSLLGRLTGSDRLEVNSFHHQAVDALGTGLRVAARAPDGTVESVWDPAARFSLGVQWHPEVLTHHAPQAELFAQLVLAARGRPALALAA